MIAPEQITILEQKLNYTFLQHDLIELAMTHPSADDNSGKNYQRLEFLGDAVVELIVSTLLFQKFPEAEEGKLSKVRSNLIDEKALAMHARFLKL
ncbi:ribonuclease III, partial [bacterium]|nr:ribonuclease III [bacterium]